MNPLRGRLRRHPWGQGYLDPPPPGWAAVAALPPLEWATCALLGCHAPAVVGTPEGWRCADHPPEWGATLDWSRKVPADGVCACIARCYCGRSRRYGLHDGGATAQGGTDLKKDRARERGTGYVSRQGATRRALERGSALSGVRPDAPDTSHALAARLAPLRERTVRLALFAAVAAWTPAQGGLTDDDLERILKRAHQSVSATRNALVADGWLEDSGARRETRYGNPAVVWRPTPAGALHAGRYAGRSPVLPGASGRLPWQR